MPENPVPAPPVQNPNESQARTWNMLCHLSALVPCVPVLVAVLIWQIKKKDIPSVDIHGKAAVNFQLTVLIAFFAVFIISFPLAFLHLGFLVSLLFPVIGLYCLVFAIIAGIKANNGEDYKYPFSLNLIK
jgi:uncharacterized Tic20 family protein